MEKDTIKPSYKELLKRGFLQFFLVGVLFSIIDNKDILAYFLKLRTITQILLFTLLGGFLYSGVTLMIRSKLNKVKTSVQKKI